MQETLSLDGKLAQRNLSWSYNCMGHPAASQGRAHVRLTSPPPALSTGLQAQGGGSVTVSFRVRKETQKVERSKQLEVDMRCKRQIPELPQSR